jgi:hypothetical protein
MFSRDSSREAFIPTKGDGRRSGPLLGKISNFLGTFSPVFELKISNTIHCVLCNQISNSDPKKAKHADGALNAVSTFCGWRWEDLHQERSVLNHAWIIFILLGR